MTRSYRIISKKKSPKQMKFLRKVAKNIEKKYGKESVIADSPCNYGLSEVYYNKNMKPVGWSEPKHWYETPEEVVKDLAFMLKHARKDLKR